MHSRYNIANYYMQLQEVCSDVGQVKHCVVLSNSPGVDSRALTIHNQVDVSQETNRVSSSHGNHTKSYWGWAHQDC